MSSWPKILHTGDVHVMNSSRHEEYSEAFEKVLSYVRSDMSPTDYVVIAGDLFHSKNVLSPESVVILTDFLMKLSEECRVIVVPGNHDANLANSSRMCSLEAVSQSLRGIESFHYLSKSGLYELYDDDVVFGVFSILEDEESWPVDVDREPGKRYVALFHGAISGSVTDVGHKIEGDVDSSSLFKDYDIALLADIHNRQFLGDVRFVEMDVDSPDELKHELGFSIVGD